MLPPPTTAATCTPSFTAAMISSATRRQLGWSTPAGPDSGIRPFLVVCLVLSVAWFLPGLAWVLSLADLEPGEAGDGDAVLRQDLLDRGLLVLHERLLSEHDVLEVGVQPAVTDPADRLPRLT